jgi:hypothetical protein
MALLRRAFAPGAVLVAGFVVGCAFLSGGGEEEGLAFGHREHVVEQGLSCTDCHRKAETDDAPGMPSMRQCMLCHEELDAEKPAERRIDTLFVEGKLRRAESRAAYPDELVFSHLAHVERAQDCNACHADVETNDHPSRLHRADMDDCTSCHAEHGAANECATCHSEIGPDWQPASHLMGWRRLHGEAFHRYSPAPAQRCDLCHTEQSCARCHEEVPPENHTNFWRLRGHGLTARMERSDCSVCHRPDMCDRCHRDAEPLSHRGASFGGARSTHCLTCHFPLQGEGCAVCHQDTPSHMTATALPPDHDPGMNCRQCHGITAPLPHVDKGDLCVACHQ